MVERGDGTGWFLFERASDGRQSGFNFNQVLCGRSTFGLIASLASELIGGEAATAADADENLEVRADVEAVIHCSRSRESTMRRWQMCIKELLTRARQGLVAAEEDRKEDWNKAQSRQPFDPEEGEDNVLLLWLLCEGVDGD